MYAADPEDVELAVKAARKAFKNPAWRDLPSVERAELLFKLVALVEKHREVLATIETWDNGGCSAKIKGIMLIAPQASRTPLLAMRIWVRLLAP